VATGIVASWRRGRGRAPASRVGNETASLLEEGAGVETGDGGGNTLPAG
jgi:hypothetical protein